MRAGVPDRRAGAGARRVPRRRPTRQVASVCPYCGVGCQLTYHVKDNHIVRVEGRDGIANDERLCVKGRFGFDYVTHPHRLTVPLIRREGAPKSADFTVDPANPLGVFREATWEEALALAGGTLRRIRDTRGRRALAGFGSAKGSNEEAYLFQKLVRTGFGSNNVDHCTRLCHASSVAALLEGIGSGAVSNPVMDVLQAEVVLLIGANPVVNHPVAATWIKNAVKQGTKLILADPRRSELARHATHYLQFKPDTDVALLNAMMHVIVEEGLADAAFIADRTSGYEALRDNVEGYSPEAMAPVCGIPADTIREVARLYATSRGSMILWGMGISQHVHGTDNARCLIALSMLTGQVGRPGTGLHPLRGQNNVQGASDAGLIPMMFPDYKRVDNADARTQFEALWGTTLDAKPGLTVVEIMDAIHAGRIRGMYIMGENPAMSDPDVHHARQALAEARHAGRAGHLPHRDLLSRRRDPAGFGVPREDRHVHQHRSRRAARPPGARSARPGAPGPRDHRGHGARARARLDVRPSARGVRRDAARHALDRRHHVGAARARARRDLSVRARGRSGRARRVHRAIPDRERAARSSCRPTSFRPPSARTREYPFVLITGRQLEHWHTGSMTRRTEVLDAIEPDPVVIDQSARSCDASALRRAATVTVASRRGEVTLYARADDGTPPGAVFIPFCYYEAAANLSHQSGARPVRQDSGVQVLRREGDPWRRCSCYNWLHGSRGARDLSAGMGPSPGRRA